MSPQRIDSAPALVGRDRELALLTGLLEQAKGGTPRFAQITGEPGIGKTYLLAELGRRADENGWLVLTGRSAEFERELPFGLVVDAFDAYLASLDARDWERIAPTELSELGGIFPSLRSVVPEPEHPNTPAERFRAHRAVVEMIERLAVRQPLLLLLDDLQWSDGASIEQAGYVLRRPPQAAVMIVGSFRAGQADPALVTAVEAASREGHVEHIELGPLAPKDAEKLLVGSARSGLYERSGGNPFFLLQLARGESTSMASALDDGAGVPAAITASIAGELEGLSPNGRTFADAAAVAGDPFDLDLAAETAGLADADALLAVDELIARDLARTTAVPRVFQFRHPLVRSAIYDGTTPGARLAAHQRAAAALAARGAAATDRAHHVEHAARHGDTAALVVLRDAGVEATARAPRTAARWFETALRLLPQDAPREDRIELLTALAGAKAATGKLEDSRAALVDAIDLVGDDAVALRVRLISASAAIEQLLGRHRDAHRRLVAALEEVGDRESPEATALMIDLAVDAFYGSDYERMDEWASEAIRAADQLDDRALAAAAYAIGAFAMSCTGAIHEAKARCDEAARLVDALSDDGLAERLDAATWLSAGEFYLERYPSGMAHAERGLEVARATAQGDLVPALTQALANLLFVTGRPVEGGELLEEAVDAARLTDSPVGLAWSLLNRSFAAYIEGDTATAVAAGEEAYELTRDWRRNPVAAWAGTYALALLDAGDPQRAADIFVERSGGPEAPAIPGGWRSNWLEWHTRALLELGRPEEAAHVAAVARSHAEELGLDLSLAGATRAQAVVALAAENAAEAVELALASADHADRVGARSEAAFARIVAGRALAAGGERERAVEVLERAASELEACRSPRHRERAEAELRKLGRGTHRRTRAGTAAGGVAALTGREMEIARLVVDRRTNAEIAGELFLSVKTVETHMRNIFRKLGVSSRVEVAREVERADKT